MHYIIIYFYLYTKIKTTTKMPFAREQLESVINEKLCKSETIKLRKKHIG